MITVGRQGSSSTSRWTREVMCRQGMGTSSSLTWSGAPDTQGTRGLQQETRDLGSGQADTSGEPWLISHIVCVFLLSLPKNLPSILTTVTDALKGMAIWMLSTSPCSCINLIPPIGVRPDDAVKGVHDHGCATCYFRRALTTARTSKRFKST
jgi:hypothetical protein